jgi:hypothetical protein
MADEKRRPGRPRRLENGDYVGFRAPRKLKAQLVEAAAAANRSISTETQVRLESTFRDENALDLAIDLAHGPRVGAVAMLLAGLMRRASDWADAAANRAPGEGDWLSDPYLYSQARQAIERVLDVLRPPGDAVVPKWPDGVDRLGARVADILLAAIAGAAEGPPGPLKGWGDKTRERLGQEIAARISAKLAEDSPTAPASATAAVAA